jgi:hypothetical protein
MARGRTKGQSMQNNPEDSNTAQQRNENTNENDTSMMEDDDMAFYSEITRPTEQKGQTEEEDQI